ncbi:hypothetical protein DDE18_12385 [Nocardioides gansuensis]|uniref:Uncharacterized protein n=1 Tax=Nocardioides gansuensis TaxID=2138300 RepID=A0A2T8F983_9ACTN|nr:hypothetical protein [Nocardioides gansuensis]PVG82288.1 hypothetical protein DDE18_12385 [Nocardioides gansuensis]
MKKALVAATLVLVGGAAVGCGGGAPTDATDEAFCDAYSSLFADAAELGDADDATIIKRVKEWGAEMEKAGTPADIPDDARAGFEKTVEEIDDLDADASQEDFEKLEEDYSDEEKRQAEAFAKYTTDTCGSPLDHIEVPEAPTEAPSE